MNVGSSRSAQDGAASPEPARRFAARAATLVLVVACGLAPGLARGAAPAPPGGSASSPPAPSALPNPFAEAVPAPGRLLVFGHFASHHRDGYGIGVGASLLPWLQVEISAGYFYELSLAGILRLSLLPGRALTPFVGLGANRAVSKLDGGLRYTTASAIGTIGLQARIARRWFVGLEVATLLELSNSARVSGAKSTGISADRVDVLPGGTLGAYWW